MSNQEITDLSYLREVAMGDEDIVIDTTRAFLEDTPAALEALHQAYTDQQWQVLYKQAHKIKPNLEYMGIERSSELIREIETQAKNEEISDDLGRKVDEFRAICTHALEELSAKVEKLEAGS